MRRANELGWPNTYTLTKSLAESLIRNFLDEHPEGRDCRGAAGDRGIVD